MLWGMISWGLMGLLGTGLKVDRGGWKRTGPNEGAFLGEDAAVIVPF